MPGRSSISSWPVPRTNRQRTSNDEINAAHDGKTGGRGGGRFKFVEQGVK